MLYQPGRGNNLLSPLEGKQLKAVENFKYLGSTVSNDASIALMQRSPHVLLRQLASLVGYRSVYGLTGTYALKLKELSTRLLLSPHSSTDVKLGPSKSLTSLARNLSTKLICVLHDTECST